VETTTGPLGQGLANAVGMALAERKLAAEFNRDNFQIIDHYTYVFLGDGCLMEGVSHEACSFAGAQRLGKLIAFWDDNGISIDGKVNDWCIDNVPERFRAYQWHVIADVDGHDVEAVRAAIKAAQDEKERPTMICCRTQIGYGSPNLSGTAKVHGAPMGKDEVALTRARLNWPYPPFEIPAEIRQAWDARLQGTQRVNHWQSLWQAYQQAHPELAAEFTRRKKDALPDNWALQQQEWINSLQQNTTPIATRLASQHALTHYATHLPELIGGSADLTESNLTHWKGAQMLSHLTPAGQYIFYGVREFAMTAIMNGMALYGGLIPFGGTFLVFTDYARNALR
ncbi:MAG TPA: thiamine pyrophosphate-dependent enzyme, partial [Gammaproteobacteria bacterium]|nr:thiamine pyrophosphate-dependent enzyme [Gammaproteobacteria bacterium]